MTEMTEKRVEEEIQYRSGIERFYERFGHAQALGYEWDYEPIKKEDYYYEYGTD